MSGLVNEADKEFLKIRCLAASQPYTSNVPGVWMPTTDIKGLTHELAKAGFICGWPISYREKGTMINAMKPWTFAESGKLDHHQRQVHGRARAVKYNGTVGLQWEVHREALALTDPNQHIHDVNVDWSAGQKAFMDIATSDLPYSHKAMDASWSPDALV